MLQSPLPDLAQSPATLLSHAVAREALPASRPLAQRKTILQYFYSRHLL